MKTGNTKKANIDVKEQVSSEEYRKTINRVSVVGMAGNFLLSAFKLIAGIVGRSDAMLTDAVHSLSDIVGSLIVMIGAGMSEKRADKEHPYGHERLESITSIVLALLLLLAAIGLGRPALDKILDGSYMDMEAPGLIALIAAIVSIVSKEGMFRYTMYEAGRIDSGSLRAEAWHHRSDALSSIGSLIGIAGARMGVKILDPLAGLVICLFILKAAFDVFKEAMDKLTDHSCPDDMEEQIRNCVERIDGVNGIDLLRTREFGRKAYVDLEIRMDGKMTLRDSHAIAEKVHDELESTFQQIKHVMVHVNPM